MIADDDGVVFVPRATAAELLEPCLARIAAEKQREATMATGASTIETFKVPTAHMM